MFAACPLKESSSVGLMPGRRCDPFPPGRISGVYKVKLYSASGEVAITFAPDKRLLFVPILWTPWPYLDPNDPGLQKSSKHQRMP